MNIQDAQMMFKQVVQNNVQKHAKEQLKFILQQKKDQLKFEQRVDKELKHVLKEIGHAINREEECCHFRTYKSVGLRGTEAFEADKIMPMMHKVGDKLKELGYSIKLTRDACSFIYEIKLSVSGWAD